MIGAMPAVAVRHERRKQKGKSTASSILGLQKGGPGGGGARPNALLLKPHLSKTAAGVGGGAHHAPSANASRQGSRAGSPSPPDDEADPTHVTTHYRYGDECFYGKLSLLHFVIFFLLGGLTVIVVGAVQFKEEAGWSEMRFEFLVVGGLLMAVGLMLLVVKCVFYRTPIPVGTLVVVDSPEEKDEKEEDAEKKRKKKEREEELERMRDLGCTLTSGENKYQRRRHSSHHAAIYSTSSETSIAAVAAAASKRRGSEASPKFASKFHPV